MATCTVSPVWKNPEAIRVVWTLTSADATGDGIDVSGYRDRCWHATGTWGGATAAAQGSNTNTDGLYAAITNAASAGTAITWTSDGSPKNSVESSQFVRPKLTTAGVGATVVVVLIAAKNPR